MVAKTILAQKMSENQRKSIKNQQMDNKTSRNLILPSIFILAVSYCIFFLLNIYKSKFFFHTLNANNRFKYFTILITTNFHVVS